jgi:transposase
MLAPSRSGSRCLRERAGVASGETIPELEILAESYAGLESVSAVARRHGLCPSQLFTWRREARKAIEEAAPVFVPAVIEPASVTAVPERSVRRRSRQARADGMVELEIDGVAVKIGRGADASVIAAVIDALKVSR